MGSFYYKNSYEKLDNIPNSLMDIEVNEINGPTQKLSTYIKNKKAILVINICAN